jgi:N-acetylmuramoyl-L-alanine amidase
MGPSDRYLPDSFHNGQYEVTAYYWYAVFDPNTGYITVYYDWVTAYFEIDNLLIHNVSVGTSGPIPTAPSAAMIASMAAAAGNDYILWDPDNVTQPPVISFDLTDTQNGTAWVKLGIYDVEQNWVAGKVITVSRPTNGAMIAWDGKDVFGNLMPKGIYLFTLLAAGEGPPPVSIYATDLYRSGNWTQVNIDPNLPDDVAPWLSIPRARIRVTFLPSSSSTTRKVRVDYVLLDHFRFSLFAASARVEVYDPDLLFPVATASGGTLVTWDLGDPIYNSVEMNVPMSKAGTYTFLISAKDSSSNARYKGHRYRAALQSSFKVRVYKVWIDAGHGQNAAGVLHPGCSCDRRRQGHEDPNDANAGLHKEHTFAYQLAKALDANMNIEPLPAGVSNTHIQKLSRDPILQTTEKPSDYPERARMAAAWKADYVICIHLNSPTTTRSLHGHRVFYYSGQTESQQFAQAVNTRLREIQFLRDDDPTRHNNLAPHSHTWTDGTRAILSSYTNLRYTSGRKIVPVLIESVYLDNTQDEDWISNAQNQATFVDKIHLGYHDLVGY